MLKTIKSLCVSIFILAFSNSSFGQENIIQGIVVDKLSKEPVDFANISIKNSATGTTTDAKGRFNIAIEKEEQTIIVISHINYHKKEVVINDSMFSGNVTIYLSAKEFQLSGVVVSAGLYEQSLDKLTKPADLILHKDIVDNMNSNMADVLNKTPGFTQVWEYHSPIILRGLNLGIPYVSPTHDDNHVSCCHK